MTAQDLSYLPNASDGYINTFGSWLDNKFTGNKEFERSLLTQEREMLFNANEAQKARDFSASEAEKNREFERAMSNTAYQRAVADLEKSGLNPYLAYTQGSASTPSGSVATPTSASVGARSFSYSQPKFIDTLSKVVKTAFDIGLAIAKFPL